jgi:hypothetical protein
MGSKALGKGGSFSSAPSISEEAVAAPIVDSFGTAQQSIMFRDAQSRVEE